MSTPYHLPVLSQRDFGLFRTPGPGLGNLLFPLARAVIGREAEGGTIVFPTMRQIKIGTYLRRERDKRTYGGILRARSGAEWADWIKVRRLPQRDEATEGEAAVIRYEGLGRQFHDLSGHADLVGDYLRTISRDASGGEPYDIAMHVRLGDFAAADTTAERQSTRLPMEWYRESLDIARAKLGGGALRGVLFTDDDPAAIIDALGIDNFTPEPPGNALTTIFTMARARLLIASRSTFSLWGQYLGQSEAIWPKGFDLDRYKPVDDHNDHFV